MTGDPMRAAIITKPPVRGYWGSIFARYDLVRPSSKRIAGFGEEDTALLPKVLVQISSIRCYRR